MLSTLKNYANIIIYSISAILIIALIVIIYFMNSKIDNLNSNINVLTSEKALCLANNISLKGTIAESNAAIEAQRIDYEAKMKDYKTIVKYRTKVVEVKSNECEDIKDAINKSVIHFNNL